MKYSKFAKALYCEDLNCRGCQERRFHLNQPLVRYVVRKQFPRSCVDGAYGAEREYHDFLQAGYAGLWHACTRRDPARSDNEWRVYAYQCIHGYIMVSLKQAGREIFLRDNGHWPILLPVDLTKVEKRGRDHYSTDDARNMGLVRQALDAIEAKQYELGNRPWWSIEDAADSERTILAAKVAQLPERLRAVLETRLDGGSLEDAGDKLGLTRERARQLQTQGLKQLFYLFHGRTAKDEEIHDMCHSLAFGGT